jgi:hypothetical protein
MIAKGALSKGPETKVHQAKLISHCPQPDTHNSSTSHRASTIAPYSCNIKQNRPMICCHTLMTADSAVSVGSVAYM